MQGLLFLIGGLALAGSAQADIYGYVDEQGMGHFSNVRQDRRYTLFVRTPGQKRAAAKPARAAGRPGRAVLARQQAYGAEVAGLAAALRLDAALLHAVITAESGYDAAARSDKGAVGLMQLMPETARRYCVKNRYDPVQNLRGGSRYLRDLLERYGNDVELALAAYNAGEGAVARHGNRIPPYPETLEYVPKVMGLYEHYRRTGNSFPAVVLAKAAIPADLGAACRLG